MRVTVVGGGVVGLTTALGLRQAGHSVEIVAEKVGVETNSMVAAAVWHIFLVDYDTRVHRWGRETLAELTRLASEVPESGVFLRRGTELVRRDSVPGEISVWASLVPYFRWMPDDLLPDGVLSAYEVEVPMADMSIYLPWLLESALKEGVTYRKARLGRLAPLFAESDAVVNCSGFGAQTLVPDAAMFPTWGQVVYVTKPNGLDTYIGDDDNPLGMTYILPRINDVVLGGCAVAGRIDEEPDKSLTVEIIRRCKMVDSRLRDFEVIRAAAGVRPTRKGGVRLERDDTLPGPMVHNYGHGGSGLSLSYGCAAAVLELLAQ